MTLFTIGADIEFPLISKETNTFVSAIPYLQGTKTEPLFMDNGATIQRDNVALEYAIPVAHSEKEFVSYLLRSHRLAKKMIPTKLKIAYVPSAHYPKSELEHPEAMEIGCSEDYDAWKDGAVNPKPSLKKIGSLRSFGGHIHVGATEESMWLTDPIYRLRFIKTMDMMLGTISAVLDNTPASIERRKLYGKAGCFRTPSYGIEYRTLSNFWAVDDVLIRLMYNLVKEAIDYTNKQFDVIRAIYDFQQHLGVDIQNLINNADNRQRILIKIIRSFIAARLFSSKTIDLIQKAQNFIYEKEALERGEIEVKDNGNTIQKSMDEIMYNVLKGSSPTTDSTPLWEYATTASTNRRR